MKEKMKSIILVFCIISIQYLLADNLESVNNAFIDVLSSVDAYWKKKTANAKWNYHFNETEEELQAKREVLVEKATFDKMLFNSVRNLNWQSISNDSMRRQLKTYTNIRESALSESDLRNLTKILTQMKRIPIEARQCMSSERNNCGNVLNRDQMALYQREEYPTFLALRWLNLREIMSAQVKELYPEYVELLNKAARLNGLKDASEMWLKTYEDETFASQIEELWTQVKPLYLEMHAYLRWRLRKEYGESQFQEKAPIPAHFLDQDWSFLAPYPQKQRNIDQALQKDNYNTVKKIFDTAADVFASINMTDLSKVPFFDAFGEQILCQNSSFSLYDEINFGITQCTNLTSNHFYKTQQLLAEFQYYLQYENQPIQFRGAPNDGFRYAVADVITLSTLTSKYLKQLGLLDDTDDEEVEMNRLYNTGARLIMGLPFDYVTDLWRWNVFKEEIKPENYNCKWWELQEDYQGVEPPVDRSEADFDLAGLHPIVDDVPYIGHFVSSILQFQFQKALCEKAGEYRANDPEKLLHKCSITGSAEAGNAFKKMLSMGSSKSWQDTMEVLTGERTLNASAMLEYFQPLRDWLHDQNTKNNVAVGWEKSNKVCHKEKIDSIGILWPENVTRY